MPVITFLSTKGGVGKTTTAMLLATELARQVKVIVFDLDPNRPISNWVKMKQSATNLSVVADATQDDIEEKIAAASKTAQFVIIDCEGVASQLNSFAAADSDLIIIPTQGSHLDAKEAARSIKMITKLTRAVPYAVLFTRTSAAVRTRTFSAIQQMFAEQGVPTFTAQINERDAYRAMFSFGKAVHELDESEVPNVKKSAKHARELAEEVVTVLARIGKGAPAFPMLETANGKS